MKTPMIARAFLALACAGSFLTGYAISVSAGAYSGTLYGRPTWTGYFTGTFDQMGQNVFPTIYSGNTEAFPPSVNSAETFINFIVNQQYYGSSGTTLQRQRGAAFIINTMLGHNAPGSYWLGPAEIEEWSNMIRSMESKGHIVWRANFSHNINSYWQGSGPNSGTIDDAFYGDVGTSPSMLFYNDAGQLGYVIRRECANPITFNTFPPLSHPWQASGSTTVTDGVPDAGDTTTAISTRPGDTVRFTHSVRNNGPGGTAPTSISWLAEQTAPAFATVFGPTNSGTYTSGQVKTFNHDVPIPLGAAPGTQYCERVGWNPVTSWGVLNGRGPPACATVVNSYNLTPTATANVPYAQAGDTVQFTYSITNSGNPSPSAVCTVRDGGGAAVVVPGLTCASGQSFPTSSTPVLVGTENFVVPANIAIGSTVCRTLTIAPATTSIASRTSPQACVTIAKTPYVHFTGGDVWAGGGFTQADGTCATNTTAKITTSSNSSVAAGSVVEYAAFALGTINKFGSGNKALFDSSNFADLGRFMTFANNTTTLGNFGAPQHCINDYAAAYETAPAISGAVDVNRPSGSWHSTGSITISGTLPAGSQQVYLVDGDITITGDLRYIGANPSYANASQIPSLLLIAKGNIWVDQAVQRIDGVFVARDTFFTCYQKPVPPSTATCANLLTVNGAVISGQLDLYRTRGADGATPAQRQLPAELFNLSPEVFLHNVLNVNSRPSVTTSDSRELPPRF